MKKNITLLMLSFFILLSCSSEEDNSVPPVLPEVVVDPVLPVAPGAPVITQAVLNGNFIDVNWSVVPGTGITYNIYRNGNPVKINAVPLSEPKFRDVLTNTGSFTYTVTAVSGNMESVKGVVSDKIILELPKTKSVESLTSLLSTKLEREYTYDTVNITKIVSETLKTTITKLEDHTATVKNTIGKYTYNGSLITKISYNNVDNNTFDSSVEYVYNEKNKLITVIRKKSDGSINYTTNYTYNDDGTTTETNSLPGSESWVFTLEKGNLVKYTYSIVKEGNTFTEVANSIFDTKDYIYKNVLGYSNFFGANISFNNQLSSSIILSMNGKELAKQSVKSEYVYNTNGYVLTKTRFDTSYGTPYINEITIYSYY